MRLAFLTHEPFYPPTGGGSAEAVYLVRELVRRGHLVHLFCPDFPDSARVAAEFEVRLHRFTAWPMGRYAALRNVKYLLYPFFLERMVRQVAVESGFAVLLSQHAIAAVAAGRLRQSLGVPVVMNFLDYLTGFMETWPVWVAPPPLVRALMRYELALPRRHGAEGVMTVSDTLADWFVEAGYPRERVQPIYYGYDAARFQPALSDAAEPQPPVVVMHGSFDHHHLGPIALEAVRRVHAARPEVRFRFVGRETPTLLAFRRRLARLAPGATLECTGFTPYEDVARHLASATVGIVPYEESRGVHCAFVAKIVEYLGTGLPVVSTPLRSAQRYFGEEPALRFAGFDGRSFGQAILDWLATPTAQRRAWGAKAAARVARELDWSAISRRAADFVERMAGSTPAGQGGINQRT